MKKLFIMYCFGFAFIANNNVFGMCALHTATRIKRIPISTQRNHWFYNIKSKRDWNHYAEEREQFASALLNSITRNNNLTDLISKQNDILGKLATLNSKKFEQISERDYCKFEGLLRDLEKLERQITQE